MAEGKIEVHSSEHKPCIAPFGRPPRLNTFGCRDPGLSTLRQRMWRIENRLVLGRNLAVVCVRRDRATPRTHC